jgi:KUP system potassium uptake protein
MSSHDSREATGKRLAALSLGAVGVVYGDIGTSPIYALKEVFFSTGHSIALNEANVLGVLSLIFWVLTLVVAVKYASLILKADNGGEGGAMVLLGLALRTVKTVAQRRYLSLLGIIGVALFFGDSIITPAVSVLGAMEWRSSIRSFKSPWCRSRS